jgi:acyl carrier protein
VRVQEFLESLAEILDVDAVKATDVLEQFPEWDSLAVLSVVASSDSKYGVNLSSAEVRGATTAQALFDLIGKKRGT